MFSSKFSFLLWGLDRVLIPNSPSRIYAGFLLMVVAKENWEKLRDLLNFWIIVCVIFGGYFCRNLRYIRLPHHLETI